MLTRFQVIKVILAIIPLHGIYYEGRLKKMLTFSVTEYPILQG